MFPASGAESSWTQRYLKEKSQFPQVGYRWEEASLLLKVISM
jgi:hypothetical protein